MRGKRNVIVIKKIWAYMYGIVKSIWEMERLIFILNFGL